MRHRVAGNASQGGQDRCRGIPRCPCFGNRPKIFRPVFFLVDEQISSNHPKDLAPPQPHAHNVALHPPVPAHINAYPYIQNPHPIASSTASHLFLSIWQILIGQYLYSLVINSNAFQEAPGRCDRRGGGWGTMGHCQHHRLQPRHEVGKRRPFNLANRLTRTTTCKLVLYTAFLLVSCLPRVSPHVWHLPRSFSSVPGSGYPLGLGSPVCGRSRCRSELAFFSPFFWVELAVTVAPSYCTTNLGSGPTSGCPWWLWRCNSHIPRPGLASWRRCLKNMRYLAAVASHRLPIPSTPLLYCNLYSSYGG